MFGLVDCNNFFVSCERVFRPDLVGRPVVVLSNNDWKRHASLPPRGQATMTPVGKIPLPLCGKIELTPENDCLSGAFFIVLSIVLTGGLTQKTNT